MSHDTSSHVVPKWWPVFVGIVLASVGVGGAISAAINTRDYLQLVEARLNAKLEKCDDVCQADRGIIIRLESQLAAVRGEAQSAWAEIKNLRNEIAALRVDLRIAKSKAGESQDF